MFVKSVDSLVTLCARVVYTYRHIYEELFQDTAELAVYNIHKPRVLFQQVTDMRIFCSSWFPSPWNGIVPGFRFGKQEPRVSFMDIAQMYWKKHADKREYYERRYTRNQKTKRQEKKKLLKTWIPKTK